MASRDTTSAGAVSEAEGARAFKDAAVCPACTEKARDAAIERFGRCELFECGACGLQFWEPREMPDGRWYEQMYGGRDETLLPLEPGHKYFLADALAPRGGNLLDIGCGTGNFLAAARDAGYRVTGIELDGKAARFAKEQVGLQRVFPLTVSEFVGRHADEKFEVVTFFEVLEHQAAPVEFLQKVKSCLKPHGTIALSVPNRERWMTGPDVLDYPPNHFLRWNTAALKKFLNARGFEVISMREQPAGVAHATQMIHTKFRTGMARRVSGGTPAGFREVMRMAPEQAQAAIQTKLTKRQRVMQALVWIKYAACIPLAAAAFPYFRMRGYKGMYLYCLARMRD
jgi:2-polyprenyl-3-methyl-5-hydroxy-6-metoxy-1,4-benzoquinol methylase